MNTENKKKPAKRFERNPKNALPEKDFTQRDIQALRDLHEHRILRTSQITTSDRQQRRLRRMFDSSHIDRWDGENEIGHSPNPKHLYTLDKRGARYLKDTLGEWARPYSGNARDNQVTHSLFVADFLLAVKKACDDTDGVTYLRQDAILAGLPRLTQLHPLRMEATVHGEPQTTVPDGLFGLEFSNGKKHYFFLEADRGTMVLDRKGKKADQLSDVRKKYEVFYNFQKTKGLCEKEFGFKVFGVLFITSSKELSRPKTLVDKLQGIHTDREGNPLGVPTWFFGHKASILDTATNVLKAQWLLGNYGEGVLHQNASKPPVPIPVN